jgi:hypothetical protein
LTGVLTAALLAGTTAPSLAQTIRGRVLEVGSETPIVAAAISVLAGGQTVVSAQSDTTGFFQVTLPGPGCYNIRVDRLGYAPVQSDTLEAGRGDVLEVLIRLGVTAVPLAPLMVVERRSMGAATEFYRRLESGRRTGLGYFITRDDLDATSVISLSAVLARVPQVGMIYDRRGKAQPVMLSHGGCRATLFLNGAPLNLAPGEAIDDLVDPAMLEGVEIYRNRTELPFEFAGPRECGAILFWTRPGESARGGLWRFLVAGGAAVGMIVWFLSR